MKDIFRIGNVTFVYGSIECDPDDVVPGNGRLVGAEPKSARSCLNLNQSIQARLSNRENALLQLGDPLRVVVNPSYFMTGGRGASRSHRAKMPKSNHCKTHSRV